MKALIEAPGRKSMPQKKGPDVSGLFSYWNLLNAGARSASLEHRIILGRMAGKNRSMPSALFKPPF
ncbi:MAG TPA: hypothetical protein VHV26_06280 [Rhizomicrobium sp.]|nr:hypothetical protein [Rhizomicrobium sp.]